MKKLLSASCIVVFSLIGCSSSKDPFVKEMTDRMADRMDGTDKDVIQACIEEQSSSLSSKEKDAILKLLDNPDGEQNFDSFDEIQDSMETVSTFSGKLFSCALSK